MKTAARDQHVFKEKVLEAAKQIGETSEQVMQWVLAVANTPLPTLSSADVKTRQYHLCAFQYLRHLDIKKTLPSPDRILTNQKGTGTESNRLLTSHELMEVEQEIKSVLDCILQKRPFAFFFPDTKRTLLYRHDPGDWIEIVTHEDPLVPFRHFFFEALKVHADDIRCCPQHAHRTCQGWFLAKRKDQRFCSPKCKNRQGAYDHRLKRGLITGRKPGRPRKRPLELLKKSRPSKEKV